MKHNYFSFKKNFLSEAYYAVILNKINNKNVENIKGIENVENFENNENSFQKYTDTHRNLKKLIRV